MGGVGDDEHRRHPFAALSEYELSYLVVHLARAGRSNDVYRLLVMQTPDGRNAWFDAKEVAQALSGYVTDIETATLAVREATPVVTGPPPLAVEYRYALMLASVTALAGQVKPPMLVALVRHGIWALDDVLTAARRASDAKQRAEALVALGPYIPDSQRVDFVDEVLQAVTGVHGKLTPSDGDSWQVEQFTALTRLVTGDVRKRLVERIVDVAIRLLRGSDEYKFADSLESLAPLLSGEQIAKLVDTAAAGQQTRGIRLSAEITLQALASHASGRTAQMIARAAERMSMNWRRAAINVRVAPNLPVAQRTKALRDAEQAAKKWNTAKILAEVLPTAPADERDGLVRQAIAAAEADDKAESHVRSLLLLSRQVDGQALEQLHSLLAAAVRELAAENQLNPFAVHGLLEGAKDLPEPLRAAMVDAALTAGRRLRQADKVHALAAVAEHVEEPRRTEILTEAVAALAGTNPISQSFALKYLAPAVPKHLAIEALRVTRKIGDDKAIREAVAAFAPYCSHAQGADGVALARSAAGAVEFMPMRVRLLAEFAHRLTGPARATVLADALHDIFDRPSNAGNVVDCLVFLAPVLVAEEHSVVVRAWKRALRDAVRVRNGFWRVPVLIGLLVAMPRTANPKREIIKGLTGAREIGQLPYWAELLAAFVLRVPVPARGRLLADLGSRPSGASDGTYAETTLAVVARHLADDDRRMLFERPESVMPLDLDIQEVRKTVDAVRRAFTHPETRNPSPYAGKAETHVAQAKHVEEPERAKALADALFEARGDAYWGIWRELGPELAALADHDLRAAIDGSLTGRATLDRKSVCVDIAHLAPMLVRFGGSGMADELTRALVDVERWWP